MTSRPATVLFDGLCNLCSAAVRFIIANDPAATFRFAALQSDAGAAALAPFGYVPTTLGSIVLIDDAGLHTQSEAALRIARGLRAPWCWTARLRTVPTPLRDSVYRFIARNRYRVFGRRTTCAQPTPEQRERFIG